jgi:hypothetical protein
MSRRSMADTSWTFFHVAGQPTYPACGCSATTDAEAFHVHLIEVVASEFLIHATFACRAPVVIANASAQRQLELRILPSARSANCSGLPSPLTRRPASLARSCLWCGHSAGKLAEARLLLQERDPGSRKIPQVADHRRRNIAATQQAMAVHWQSIMSVLRPGIALMC